MVSVIKILRCVEHFTLHLIIFRKQVSASLIKMKFAIIQARFINIVVVNINKSSAQTILFHLNIEFTNFFRKMFIRSVHYTGETYLGISDIFTVIQFTNSFHTLSDIFDGLSTFRKIICSHV